jgi:ABC-type nitrate/sulfonate/bicarbonate transport system substrate-binding protein
MHLSMLHRDVDRLPYLIALKRMASERGLDIEIRRHQQSGAEDWGENLRSGAVDLIAENSWALQRYRAKGVPFVSLASAAHEWQEILVARDGIKTLADLRGKKLAVRLTGPQASFPKVLLDRVGLAGQVEFVVFSEKETGRWGHWKKVADGTCDACFMLPSYIAPAYAAGLQDVPYPVFAFDGAHIVPTTTEAFVAANRTTIRTLVESMFDTNARVNADPDFFRDCTAEAREGLLEHFTFDDAPAFAQFCAAQRAEIAPLPIPTAHGIANAYDVAVPQFPDVAGFNSLEMWDLSFAREILNERQKRTETADAAVAAPPGDIRK